MEDQRFDAVVRSLGRGASQPAHRRRVLQGLVGAVLGGSSLTGRGSAAEARPQKRHKANRQSRKAKAEKTPKICTRECAHYSGKLRSSCKKACKACGGDFSRICPTTDYTGFTCCAEGTYCADAGVCCAENSESCFGPTGTVCCTEGTICNPYSGECVTGCGEGREPCLGPTGLTCCGEGESCAGEGVCCTEDSQPCSGSTGTTCCGEGTICNTFEGTGECVTPAVCGPTLGCYGGQCAPFCFCVSTVEGTGACVSEGFANCFAQPCETSTDCGTGGLCVDVTSSECCAGSPSPRICFPADALCEAGTTGAGNQRRAGTPGWQ